MKKVFVLLFFISCICNRSEAQSFTMQADTVLFTMPGPSAGINDIDDSITANASQVTLHWHVIYCNIPASATSFFGICDNVGCSILNQLWPASGMRITAPYTGSTGGFYLAIIPDTALSNGCYYITVALKDDATNDSTNTTFATCITPASVPQVSSKLQKIQVYPNPATDVTTLSFNLADAGIVAISICDATGREVYNRAAEKMPGGTNYVHIPVANFANGVYYITINIAGERMTQKLSVIR